MSDTPRGILALVAIPALITLAVTGLRVYGELQGWYPKYFNPEAGGGGSLLGITWLVLPVGFWFGRSLQRSGQGPENMARSMATYAAGVALLGGGLIALLKSNFVKFPTPDSPGPFEGMPLLLALMACAFAVAMFAWPRLTIVLVVYGLLARIPVIILSYCDVQNGWATHYGELPPGATVADDTDRLIGLIAPQLTLWPLVFTTLIGGVLGCLGSRFASRGSN